MSYEYFTTIFILDKFCILVYIVNKYILCETIPTNYSRGKRAMENPETCVYKDCLQSPWRPEDEINSGHESYCIFSYVADL